MNEPSNQCRLKVEEFLRRHRIGVLTLMFTDMVGSTRLKQILGDAQAFLRIKEHHTLVRELLAKFEEAEEINTAGDSFFIVFARPSEAVRFALGLQARLRQQSKVTGVPLQDRIGIHVGEVVIDKTHWTDGSKDLYGLQVDTCGRVMSLAEGNQVLMSRMVFDNARQILRGHELEGGDNLSWVNHGPYQLKGVEEPIDICEVGEIGLAVLTPPGDSEKAHRQVSPGDEPVLGWRPSLGATVPQSRWILDEKLGEGAFGEVWLASHATLKDRRVLKFCFKADRVRSLKREATIFKLLRERVGEHPGIVRVHDLFLDEPPYYLVMDYIPGRDLRSWSLKQGGLIQVPMAKRIEIVARVAEVLQSAHESGIIHRDVKPSNVLIAETDGQLEVRLTDFGIGQVTSPEALAGMTKMGFTQTLMSSGSSGQAGTQTYMAPELLAGKPATTRSDLYSLGVLLYQVVLGEWDKPVTVDWTRQVTDPLLREDLTGCFAGDPKERLDSAGELAKRLRALETRRTEREQEASERMAREKAAYRRGLVRAWATAGAVVALFIALTIIAFRSSSQARLEQTKANRSAAEVVDTIDERELHWLTEKMVPGCIFKN